MGRVSEYTKNPDELGALWLYVDPVKGEYMTGKISGVDVRCSLVKSDNPKSPTWRVMKRKPREAKPDVISHPSEPVNDSDIPF